MCFSPTVLKCLFWDYSTTFKWLLKGGWPIIWGCFDNHNTTMLTCFWGWQTIDRPDYTFKASGMSAHPFEQSPILAAFLWRSPCKLKGISIQAVPGLPFPFPTTSKNKWHVVLVKKQVLDFQAVTNRNYIFDKSGTFKCVQANSTQVPCTDDDTTDIPATLF
jgi:hypothetical protein